MIRVLFFALMRTIQYRRRNPHLRQLRRLILHESDQRRNHNCGALRYERRQLVAQRLASARRHHDAGIVSCQQAATIRSCNGRNELYPQ